MPSNTYCGERNMPWRSVRSLGAVVLLTVLLRGFAIAEPAPTPTLDGVPTTLRLMLQDAESLAGVGEFEIARELVEAVSSHSDSATMRSLTEEWRRRIDHMQYGAIARVASPEPSDAINHITRIPDVAPEDAHVARIARDLAAADSKSACDAAFPSRSDCSAAIAHVDRRNARISCQHACARSHDRRTHDQHRGTTCGVKDRPSTGKPSQEFWYFNQRAAKRGHRQTITSRHDSNHHHQSTGPSSGVSHAELDRDVLDRTSHLLFSDLLRHRTANVPRGVVGRHGHSEARGRASRTIIPDISRSRGLAIRYESNVLECSDQRDFTDRRSAGI